MQHPISQIWSSALKSQRDKESGIRLSQQEAARAGLPYLALGVLLPHIWVRQAVQILHQVWDHSGSRDVPRAQLGCLPCRRESWQSRGGSLQCPGLDLIKGGGGFLPNSGSCSWASPCQRWPFCSSTRVKYSSFALYPKGLKSACLCGQNVMHLKWNWPVFWSWKHTGKRAVSTP